MSLFVFPCTLEQANELVASMHRHHKPDVKHRFSIGVMDENGIVHGAAIIGRPVARMIDQYNIAEVSRLVTDGHKNACSMLYAAAARACQAMGFYRIQTYILDNELGTSLKASGWKFDYLTHGRDWNCPSRGGRRTDQPMNNKQLWYRQFNERPMSPIFLNGPEEVGQQLQLIR